MREVSFADSVIHSASTVGGGADLSVAAGSGSRGTHSFTAEPNGERAIGHYPGRRAGFRRRTGRRSC